MKILKIVSIIAGAALLFALGWNLSPSPGPASDEVEAEEAAENGTVWTCSMHPQVRQPDPGSCPICGMDLIPLEEDDEEDDAELPVLRLSERSIALMNIRTTPVTRREAHVALRLPGRVEADETRLSLVTAWFSGRADRLVADFTGTLVQTGDPLLELYSPEIFTAQEELLQALRTYQSRPDDSTRRLLEDARKKLSLLGLSAQQLEELESSEEASTHLTFASPSTGFVVERLVTTGQYVEKGTPLYSVADLSTVWLQLEAFESDLPFLRTGQMVEVALQAFPGKVFEGEIDFIDPVVHPRKRSARVRVSLPNGDFRIKPEMLARGTVHARLDEAGDAADDDSVQPKTIPASAPLFTGKRSIVYVRVLDTERPTFEAREVTLGSRVSDGYIVLDGLEEGELVVVNGQFKIDSELQIRGRPSMMAPEGDAPPAHDHGDHADHVDDADPRQEPERKAFADAVDADFGEEIRPLFEAYLILVEGLADDDAGAAVDGLKSLHDHLLEIGQHRLSGDAHVAWMEHYDQLHQLTHAMAEPADLEDLRSHLQELTLSMEKIHVNFGAGQLPALNRAFCPMVEGGREVEGMTIGSWLQEGEEIRNPYFGASMLRCGEVYGQL